MKPDETRKSISVIGLFCALVTIFLFSTGCVVHESYGDPYPWSPSHHNRAKYHYRYYPSLSVYFDIDRNVYFYPESGRWKRGKSYPYGQHRNSGYVDLDMDTDKPYKWHSDVERRYPRDYRNGSRDRRDGTDDRRRDERRDRY